VNQTNRIIALLKKETKKADLWAELALLLFTKLYESKITLLGQYSDSFLRKIQFKE